VLGFVSIVSTSLGLSFASKFVFVFLSAFFAIFLGVMVLRGIRPYRRHLLDAGLAVVGILTASVSCISLFASL
jgi:hypothetical protein